jgi:hypothetical protein
MSDPSQKPRTRIALALVGAAVTLLARPGTDLRTAFALLGVFAIGMAVRG